MSEREEKIAKYKIEESKDVSIFLPSQKEWNKNDGCDAKWLYEFVGDFIAKNPTAHGYEFVLLDGGHNGATLEAYGIPKTEEEIDGEIAKIEGYEEAQKDRKERRAKEREERERKAYLRLKEKFEGVENV